MASQAQLQKEVFGWQSELEDHRRKVKAKKEPEMPLYEAWLEFCIKVNQRELARVGQPAAKAA